MAAFFTFLNDWLWGNILVAALVCCGLWFTWRTRFVQFRMIGEMIRLLGDSAVPSEKGKRHICSDSHHHRRPWGCILDVGYGPDGVCNGVR